MYEEFVEELLSLNYGHTDVFTARDIVHKGFEKILKPNALNNFKAETETDIKNYLKRTMFNVRNTLSQKFRKKKNTIEIDSASDYLVGEAIIDNYNTINYEKELKKVKSLLKPDDIPIFELLSKDYKVREIALELGYTENKVKMIVKNARNRVKDKGIIHNMKISFNNKKVEEKYRKNNEKGK
jgi:RNA polymerase sigma factor (sigma-70 family)